MTEMVTLAGTADQLHDRAIASAACVEVLRVEKSAVVLGSTQDFGIVDTEAARRLGFDVVRRRSGGGVVILQPGDHGWLDVTVPRGHQLWNDDVGRATWWIGDVWCEILGEVLGAALHAVDRGGSWTVHRGTLQASAAERSVCFASVGPGEVLRDDAGVVRKVVGVSQRRTKDAARFQCTLFRAIDVELYAQLLREPLPASLATSTGVGDALDEVAASAARRFLEILG